MSLFTSLREKKLWLLVLAVIGAIFITLFVGQPLAALFGDQDIQAVIFLFVMLLIGITILIHGLTKNPSKTEWVLWFGIAAVYIMFFLRLGLPERSHLMEYSVLAIFFNMAIMERINQGKKIPTPALLSFLIPFLVGVVDECIQCFIPHRYFDINDILFNGFAVAMAIGSRVVLKWIRLKRSSSVKSIIVVMASATLASCSSNHSNSDAIPVKLYEAAVTEMKSSNYDSALLILDQALEAGLKHPMQLIIDSHFYHFVDDALFRPKFRGLIRKHSTESHAQLTRNDEEGEPLRVRIQILDEATQEPVSGVAAELVHTDSLGFYFTEKTMWNPRIFGYLVSDDQGMITINTIYPGSYKDDKGLVVATHIHFNFSQEGYRPYGSEFTFEDDPIFIANGNEDNVPVARRNAEGNQEEYLVKIYLQQN